MTQVEATLEAIKRGEVLTVEQRYIANKRFRSMALRGYFPMVRMLNPETQAYEFEFFDETSRIHLAAMNSQLEKYTRTIRRNIRCKKHLQLAIPELTTI